MTHGQSTEPDNDFIDGCEVDFAESPVDDVDILYVALFAEALDPDTPKTVDEAAAEWVELFGA